MSIMSKGHHQMRMRPCQGLPAHSHTLMLTHLHALSLAQPCTNHTHWCWHSHKPTQKCTLTPTPLPHTPIQTHSHSHTNLYIFKDETAKRFFPNKIYVSVTVLKEKHLFKSTYRCHWGTSSDSFYLSSLSLVPTIIPDQKELWNKLLFLHWIHINSAKILCYCKDFLT